MPDALDRIRAASATAPHITRRMTAPTGFEPGITYQGGRPAAVTLRMGQIPPDEQAWRDAIHDKTGLDIPEGRRVQIDGVRYWGQPGAENIYVRFSIVDRTPTEGTEPLEFARLIHKRRKASPTRPVKAAARVVVLSDAQIGKVDAAGGTPEFEQRLHDKLDKLTALMRRDQAPDLVIVDPGDLIENNWNTRQQAFTNDRGLADQLAIARSVIRGVVDQLSALADRTRVVTVPSNHGQIRVALGKDGGAGPPGNDFGIDTHRAVAESFAFAGRTDVAWMIPDPWVESLAIEVTPGFVVGVVHGHQWRPGKAADWWRGQSLGDGPTAAAHLLIHGHLHHAELTQAGHLDGKPRWILQADAMDGGSSWFTNLSGDKAEPSITTFTVTPDGRWDHYRRIT